MSKSNGLSRREFLRALAGSAAAVAAGAAGVQMANAASENATELRSAPRAQGAEVVLLTGGYPFYALPDAEPEGGYDSYSQALLEFYDKNPNIRLEAIDFDIWTANTLRTGIAGGTAPAFYYTGVIGSWSTAGIQAAYKQGLFADITEAFLAYDIESKVNEGFRTGGRPQYLLDGVYFGVPIELTTGNGVIYRRDLIAAAGLEEPTVEWTWDDAREIASALTTETMKGIAAQGSGALGAQLGSEGYGWENLFSVIPDPESSWNWRRDWTSNPEVMERTVNRLRTMIYEDESYLTDITYTDSIVNEQFFNESAAMATIPGQFFTRTGSAYAPDLARKLDKPLDEVAGFLPHPRGVNGHYSRSSTPYFLTLGFNPDLTSAEKDAIVRLYNFMYLEEGFDIQRRILYENTGDLQQAFNAWPFVRAKDEIEGVEGSAREVWGRFADVVAYMLSTAGMPQTGEFLPPEETGGPTGDAWNDAQSSLTFEAGEMDIMAVLADAEQIWNEQAAGFVSSVPDDVFVEGATAYYEALDAYWESNFPDFRDEVYKPWVEEVIAPILGM